MEFIESVEKQKKKKRKSHNRFRDLWDTISRTNIHIIGAPKEEENEKGT